MKAAKELEKYDPKMAQAIQRHIELSTRKTETSYSSPRKNAWFITIYLFNCYPSTIIIRNIRIIQLPLNTHCEPLRFLQDQSILQVPLEVLFSFAQFYPQFWSLNLSSSRISWTLELLRYHTRSIILFGIDSSPSLYFQPRCWVFQVKTKPQLDLDWFPELHQEVSLPNLFFPHGCTF